MSSCLLSPSRTRTPRRTNFIPPQDLLPSRTVLPDSRTTAPPAFSKTGLGGPEHGRTSEGKQAVKYFKTWYFTRNSPSEGPKIHSLLALNRVGGPAQGLAARSSPSQQGERKTAGYVWGHQTKGFSTGAGGEGEGRGRLPALLSTSCKECGDPLSCERRE